jgi:hypothetical protein
MAGVNFRAMGNVAGMGIVEVNGTINPNRADFVVTSQIGYSTNGYGEVFQDPEGRWHMNYALNDGMGTTGQFHMNHNHMQP